MATSDHGAYSTLEVAPHHGDSGHASQDYGKVPLGIDHAGLEAAEKRDHVKNEAWLVPPAAEENAPEVAPKVSPAFGGQDFKAPHRRSRRYWAITVAIIAVIIILAAVLGGVLGSRASSSGGQSSMPSAPVASSATSQSPRHIAAISLDKTASSRVYYLDESGQIVESSSSVIGPPVWTTRRTGITARPGSPLAAAVAYPADFPPIISVYYLDANNVLKGNQTNTLTTAWQPLTNLASQGYTVMANSSLAAMRHECRLCSNTSILAFQDQNGFVQIVNSTALKPSLMQLGQDLQPLPGTGLALHPFYRVNEPDQINLFYQKANLSLALATWRLGQPEINSWALSAQVYSTIPPGSPIAAAASYSNVSTGYETWIEVLTLSNTGVRVSYWAGMKNDWLDYFAQPSQMANSSSNMTIYGALAVDSNGAAFSVVSQEGKADEIGSWQVGTDLVDWTSAGTVDLNGTWT